MVCLTRLATVGNQEFPVASAKVGSELLGNNIAIHSLFAFRFQF
jgi:hypothetical protein